MLLTIEEAAEFLKLSKITVYKMCVAGTLPCLKVGGSWRILKDDLIARLKDGERIS